MSRSPEVLAARYPPQSDVATHQQVFFCPQCGARLLGPPPHERRPYWRIPLLCCPLKPAMPFDLDLDKPPLATREFTYLELRKHVWANWRTGERVYIWLPQQ